MLGRATGPSPRLTSRTTSERPWKGSPPPLGVGPQHCPLGAGRRECERLRGRLPSSSPTAPHPRPSSASRSRASSRLRPLHPGNPRRSARTSAAHSASTSRIVRCSASLTCYYSGQTISLLTDVSKSYAPAQLRVIIINCGRPDPCRRGKELGAVRHRRRSKGGSKPCRSEMPIRGRSRRPGGRTTARPRWPRRSSRSARASTSTPWCARSWRRPAT